jgi:hypothetical protein
MIDHDIAETCNFDRRTVRILALARKMELAGLSHDDQLQFVIKNIPQQAQRQYGTDEQMRYLYDAANKLGLYDAADRIRELEGF